MYVRYQNIEKMELSEWLLADDVLISNIWKAKPSEKIKRSTRKRVE